MDVTDIQQPVSSTRTTQSLVTSSGAPGLATIHCLVFALSAHHDYQALQGGGN
jgi:hypothetical protein